VLIVLDINTYLVLAAILTARRLSIRSPAYLKSIDLDFQHQILLDSNISGPQSNYEYKLYLSYSALPLVQHFTIQNLEQTQTPEPSKRKI